MGYGFHEGWGMGGGWLWPLILVVIIVVLLMRRGTSRPSHSAPPSALEELERRYARGEIGREEFLQKKSDLAR